MAEALDYEGKPFCGNALSIKIIDLLTKKDMKQFFKANKDFVSLLEDFATLPRIVALDALYDFIFWRTNVIDPDNGFVVKNGKLRPAFLDDLARSISYSHGWFWRDPPGITGQ